MQRSDLGSSSEAEDSDEEPVSAESDEEGSLASSSRRSRSRSHVRARSRYPNRSKPARMSLLNAENSSTKPSNGGVNGTVANGHIHNSKSKSKSQRESYVREPRRFFHSAAVWDPAERTVVIPTCSIDKGSSTNGNEVEMGAHGSVAVDVDMDVDMEVDAYGVSQIDEDWREDNDNITV